MCFCWLIVLTDLEKGNGFLRLIYGDTAAAVHSKNIPLLSPDSPVLHFVPFSSISFSVVVSCLLITTKTMIPYKL